jgi:cobaltochelatase CobT
MSDGAPVDDATLMHNGRNYLWRHLLAVLADARRDPALTMGAVGIGYDVSSLYPLSQTVYAPVDVPSAAADVLARMLVATKEKAGFLRSRE